MGCGTVVSYPSHGHLYSRLEAGLAKRREMLIFPRMVGNTGNSREILGFTGKSLNMTLYIHVYYSYFLA